MVNKGIAICNSDFDCRTHELYAPIQERRRANCQMRRNAKFDRFYEKVYSCNKKFHNC